MGVDRRETHQKERDERVGGERNKRGTRKREKDRAMYKEAHANWREAIQRHTRERREREREGEIARRHANNAGCVGRRLST